MIINYTRELGDIRPGKITMKGLRNVSSNWEHELDRRKKYIAGSEEELRSMIGNAKTLNELQLVLDCNHHVGQSSHPSSTVNVCLRMLNCYVVKTSFWNLIEM